ncbi:MAG TPA: T9SS type A sorting domain-containing protein [Flavisolibacter sp.]|nr:T9SS type A sorting domain-containing protein [Flavisolibacter sp.]
MKQAKNFFLQLFITAALLPISFSAATQTVVVADPSLGSFDITNVDGSSLNANLLQENKFYTLKLSVQNLHFTNAIPDGSAFVDIGLGSKMTFDSTINLNPASLTDYFSFQFVNGAQKKIRCILKKPLPNDYYGEVSFRVRPNVQGSSVVTGNFLVYNSNAAYTLSDINSNNNTADISYTVVANATLPVNLVDFKGLVADCKYNIRWQVANEVNLDRYIVESSLNGREFTRLTEVAASGSTSYSAELPVDNQVKAVKLALRLRMVDRDGSAKYSDVVYITNTCLPKSNNLLLYPNPVKETEALTISSRNKNFSGRYVLQVVDVSGKIVLQRTISLQDVQRFSFPHRQLVAGKYFLLLENEAEGKSEVLSFEKL